MEGASYKQLVTKLLAGLTEQKRKEVFIKDGRAKGKLVLRRYHAPVALRLLGAAAATATVTLRCFPPSRKASACLPPDTGKCPSLFCRQSQSPYTPCCRRALPGRKPGSLNLPAYCCFCPDVLPQTGKSGFFPLPCFV